METALLVRHAESEASVLGLVNGDPSRRVGLSPEGVRQARRLREVLAAERVDLCVVTEFPRTVQTADLALAGRDLPGLLVPELNDPHYGAFEGRTLDEYRAWVDGRSSADVPPGGGESRLRIVERYVRGFRRLLERPERVVLAVLHSLPLAYVLAAAEGRDPEPRMPLVDYATVFRLERGELAAAVDRLDAWVRSPTW